MGIVELMIGLEVYLAPLQITGNVFGSRAPQLTVRVAVA